MTGIFKNWSATAASNTTAATGIAVDNGTLFGSDHPSIRSIMASIKAAFNQVTGAKTSGGSANAQTFTSDTTGAIATAYAAGMSFRFKAGFTNTGATTFNVDGVGAVNIFLNGVALSGGEIVAGQIYDVAYDGTQFALLNPSRNPLAQTGEEFINLGVTASVGSSALTVNIKGADGNDPSAANPVVFNFRNSTEATGTPVQRALSAASSIVISSGSTLGPSAINTPFALWLVMFDDAGTLRPGLVNCKNATSIFPLASTTVASSTAEGGAGAADSAQVFYTGTSVSSKAYVILARLEWASGLATLGTWATGPTKIELATARLKRPGDVVQALQTTTSTQTTTTSSTFQNTNASQAITLTSAANQVRGRVAGDVYNGANTNTVIVSVFRDSTNLGAQQACFSTVQTGAPVSIPFTDYPGSASSLTYMPKVRSLDNTNTVTFASSNGSVNYASIQLEEVQV